MVQAELAIFYPVPIQVYAITRPIDINGLLRDGRLRVIKPALRVISSDIDDIVGFGGGLVAVYSGAGHTLDLAEIIVRTDGHARIIGMIEYPALLFHLAGGRLKLSQ